MSTFPCPSCGQHIETALAYVGTNIACPACGNQMVAPDAVTVLDNPIPDTPAEPATKDTDLTIGDWVICVLCSGAGCIVGIIRAIQGKPNARKMIGLSIFWMFVWAFIKRGL